MDHSRLSRISKLAIAVCLSLLVGPVALAQSEYAGHKGQEAPDEAQPDPPQWWLGVRLGFSFGGDNLITGTMSDGSTRTLDAGKGDIVTFNGSTAPWWISNVVGFGAGIELGFKYGGISASNGSASLMRYPLAGFLQALARLSDNVFILARGGIDKDLSVHLSGDGVLSNAKADFTSNVGLMGEIGIGYHYYSHLLFDATFRYTRVTYSIRGESFDGSNGGLMMGISFLF